MSGKIRVSRLKDVILPSLIKEGKLKTKDRDVKISDVEITSSDRESEHWASCIFYVKVHLEHKDRSRSVEHFVIKFPPTSKILRLMIKTDEKFENECFMYQTVITKYFQFLEEQSQDLQDNSILKLGSDLLPKCHYAEFGSKKSDNAMVVLEDLREYGYKLSTQKNSLDLHHVKLAVTELGRFHGIGYAMKLKKGSEFQELVSRLKPAGFSKEDRNNRHLFLDVCASRAVARLLQDLIDPIPADVLHKLSNIFKDTFSVMLYLRESGESSVLCHGDFRSNNLMYHYSNAGTPNKVILLDLQKPIYASPAIDLSYFLFCSTDSHFRNEHFQEVFRLYHSSVTETINKILGHPLDDSLFSLQVFKKDFKRYALYGYFLCSFYLPIMINSEKEGFDLEAELKKINSMNEKEKTKILLSRGGEAATVALVELFEEFYERGLFEDLLTNYSTDTHF